MTTEVKPPAAIVVDKPADAVVPPVKPAEVKPTEVKPVEVSPPVEPVKPAAVVNVVPEKYEFKIPENSLLDEAYVEQLSSYAKENKLSNEQAQLVLEREHKAAQAGFEAIHKQTEELSKQWLKDGMADKEIGGDKYKETVLIANDALDKLFPGVEIRKIMDSSGLGNHPTVLKGFAKIGAMLKNDKIHPAGNPPPSKPPLKDRMYNHPTSPKS